MLRFALLALLIALTAQLRAERYDLDRYKATVNVPDTDGWFRKGGPQLRTGEFAVYAVNSSNKGRFGVAALPGFPTTDIRHATVLSRIMETMRGEGFEPTRQRFGTQEDLPYVEIIGSGAAENGDKFVMVARAVLRNSFLFIAFQASKGGDDDADKPEFMAHIETLRFDVPTGYSEFKISTEIPQLLPWHFRAYRVAALAAGTLALAFCVMLFVTRHRQKH